MQEPSAQELGPDTIAELDKQLDALQQKAVQRLKDQVGLASVHGDTTPATSRQQIS
jgi:hypothetical protein